MIQLTGVRDAARALGIANPAARDLVDAGLVSGYSAAGGVYMKADDVQELRDRPKASPRTNAIIARVGPRIELDAESAREQGRRFAGWDQAVADSGPSGLADAHLGIDRYWQLRPQPGDDGCHFIAAVRSIVVATGIVKGIGPVDTVVGGRIIDVCWQVLPDVPVGAWLRSGPGGPMIRWP